MRFHQISAALFLSALLTGGAEAKSFSVPADNPTATVDVPDDWTADTREQGAVIATSEDNAITILAASVPAANADEVVQRVTEAISEKKDFKPDPSTKKTEAAEADLDGNHAKMSAFSVQGDDTGGPASMKITTYALDKHPSVVFILALVVGSQVTREDGEAAGKVMESIHFTP